MSFLPQSLASLARLDMLPGQSMEINLPEPASAGYLWQVEEAQGVEATLVRPVADTSSLPPADPSQLRIGQSGTVRLHLVAPSVPGQGMLRLVLSQPWKGGAIGARLDLPVDVDVITPLAARPAP